MENKEIAVQTVEEVESMLICVSIAICGALTKEQRKQVSASLRLFGEHFVDMAKDERTLAFGVKLQSLSQAALGDFPSAQAIPEVLKAFRAPPKTQA